MLRINLLPPYIYEGSKRRNVLILWVIILVAVIAGGLVWNNAIHQSIADLQNQQAQHEPKAADADKKAADAAAMNTQSATIRAKADFVRNARKYDEETYPNLVRNIAMYTINRVLYDYIQPNGDTVNMSAYTPTLADVAHYMMVMERNPKITKVDVSMNSIPGIPNTGGQQQQSNAPGVRPDTGGGHDFLVTLHLVTPIPAGPTYGGGGGGAASGGGPSMGGGPMGGGKFGPMGPGPMGGGMGSGGPGMGSGGPGMGSGGMGGKLGGA